MSATNTLHLTDAQIAESAHYHARRDWRRSPRDPRNAVVVGRGHWGHGDEEPEPDEKETDPR